MKKLNITKSKFFLALPIALISLKMYFGGIFGYLTANFLSKRINSVVLSLGNYRLHFHHWMMGTLALVLTIFYNITPLMDQLFFGFLGGLIFQGIFSYSDWHRILSKQT